LPMPRDPPVINATLLSRRNFSNTMLFSFLSISDLILKSCRKKGNFQHYKDYFKIN
jgi:hypothetical protein